MSVRNAHFYNRNETRAYPLDETATGLSDAGERLPADVLADLHVKWPNHLGSYAFVSAVSNTDNLVTLTLQAADTPTGTAAFTPLAVVSVRKPLTPGRMYPLQPQADGVAGWVAFGSGDRAYRGRFSGPGQSRLCVRAAKPYRPLPVQSLQAKNAAQRLTGVVTLKVTDPLAVAKEERFIDGALRDCIVVRLVDGEGAEGFPVPAAASAISGFKQQSIFQQFAGPCSGRPESNTCGCPFPVEFINAVAPDCFGVLTVEFRGCTTVAQLANLSGIAIACELGLVDACVPIQIPSSEGLLPSEYNAANVPVPPDVVPPPDEVGESASYYPIVGGPFVTCFSTPLDVPLTTLGGAWQWVPDDSPEIVCPEDVFPVSASLSASESGSVSFYVSDGLVRRLGAYAANTAATRNVAVWDAVDTPTVYRRVTTACKLVSSVVGIKRNAAVVLNHKLVSGRYVYFQAEIDYEAQEFRISRFNGLVAQELESVSVPIQLDKWYEIRVDVGPGPVRGSVTLTARLRSLTDPGVTDEEISTTATNYLPSDGEIGIATNKALSRFGYLKVEETP